MSSPLLQPLTVLFVSPDGQPPGQRPIDAVDPAIDAEFTASIEHAMDRIGMDDSGGDRIDAIVCEHRPPQVDAVGFVTTLRDVHPELPAIVVPAGGAQNCTEAALSAGATDVVQTTPSSLSPAVLANRIRQFVHTDGSDVEPPAPSSTPARGKGQESGAELTEGSGGDLTGDERIARLDEAVQQIRHAGQPETVAEVVADVAGDILDAPGVGVFLFDDEENLLHPAAITDAMCDYYGGETVFGPGKPDSITWQVFVSGESELFDDLRSSGVHVNGETAARGSMFVPIGEHGVLVASTDVVAGFSESSREVVELLATTAAATLDRIESTAALRHRDRRLREQENRLQHVDRGIELARAADRAVVGADTREELESAVLTSLVDEGGFDFAWIGDFDSSSGTLVPRAWTDGGRQYLDEVRLAVTDSDEPSCRTARERQATAEPNVAEALDGDGWERNALSWEFHSVLSVPLKYGGVLYGVLTVYADRPDGFTEPLASLLEGIGETTAYAINATERKFSMLSDGVTELELRIDGADDVLNVIAESIGTPIECVELTPLSDGSTKLLFSAAGVSAESVLSTMAGLVAVDSVTHVTGGEDHVFKAVIRGEMVGSVVASAGGIPRRVVADEHSLDATVHVPGSIDAETFHNRLRQRYPDTELRARRERNRSAMTRNGFLTELEAALTERQLEVLRTAYESGFFSSPREATGQDVADRLGVSQPTVSHHLRASQGTLFSLLFDE